MIYHKMLQEQQHLQEHIFSLEDELSHFPEGKICCVHDKNRIKWFQNLHGKYFYISTKKKKLIRQLVNKKFLQLQLDDCLQEKRAIDFYLKHYHADKKQALQDFLSEPAYFDVLSDIFKPLSDELNDWMHEPFEGNPSHPEQLIFRTSSGNIVRSKSEVLIDMSLFTNKIPFRYENPLTLENITIYPDFTIRHPQTGEFFYWEHFGMMDNPEYSKHAFSKLQLYAQHQIIPTHQLITTYETRENPFLPEQIEQVVEQYFL